MHRATAALAALALVLALPSAASACIWDSDTLKEELDARGDYLRVITGETIRHAPGYYKARLVEVEAELAENPESLEARYDAAVAWMQLGAFKKAHEHLDQAEALAPGRYKGLSNRAVLLEREGRFEDALALWGQVLDTNPGAHFRAGWLHPKLVAWRMQRAVKGPPEKDLFGKPYNASPYSGSRVSREARTYIESRGLEWNRDEYDAIGTVASMVRANPESPEMMFQLGRVLHDEMDLNFALWAYGKALRLEHPRPKIIRGLIAKIFEHWKETLSHKRTSLRLTSIDDALAALAPQFDAADAYTAAYMAEEVRMIEAEGAFPTADAIRAALAKKGIERITPKAVGLVGPQSADEGPSTDSRMKGARSRGATPGNAPTRNAVPSGAHREAQSDAEGEDADAQGAPMYLGDAPPADDAKSTPRHKEGGIPLVLWFGFAMLAISLLAVAFAKRRTA